MSKDLEEDVLLQVDTVRSVFKYILPLMRGFARLDVSDVPDATDSLNIEGLNLVRMLQKYADWDEQPNCGGTSLRANLYYKGRIMNQLMLKYRVALIVIFLTSVVLVSCERTQEPLEQMLLDAEMSEQEISLPIGVVVSETGIWADLYGLPMQRGFALALEEINAASLLDVPLSFVTIDDESTLAGSTQAVTELVDQGCLRS